MAFKVLIPPTHTITAKAADDLLAGYFVKAMSIADIASTTAFETTLVVEKMGTTADSSAAVGIALGSVSSGNAVAIATDGVFTHLATYATSAGNYVGADDSDPLAIRAASYTCTGSTNALQYIKPVGTAWSSAASGEQVVFKLNL